MFSGALSTAVRWDWIPANPAAVAKKPRQPRPQPKPPSAEQAARIVAAAWEQDVDWGTLVWLVMVTGMRRGELAALRWHDVHLDTRILEIRRSYTQRSGQETEKDTKTHQMRRIALDDATVEVLAEHLERYAAMAGALGLAASEDAFVFSYEPDHGRPFNPDAVTHRYGAMCTGLGIDSHLHALRHYSATELISAGVDVRTVAGRLGHGGGGTTTLRDGRVTSKQRLLQLVESLPDEQADELLRPATGLYEVPNGHQALPAFVGIGDSGRPDVATRADELLGDGFGR